MARKKKKKNFDLKREYRESLDYRIWRRSVFERDNYTCQYCSTKEQLSIHHIDFNKFNNKKSNLITACMSCNSKLGDSKTRKNTLLHG